MEGRFPRLWQPSANREVALGILAKFGLSADAVADGSEAISALERIPYDLVLMDMRMPLMDGIEATRQIRDPKSAVLNHAAPIIALTANAVRSEQQSCLDAGMNGFVPKPISRPELENALKKWLWGDAAQSAASARTSSLSPAHAESEIFDKVGVLKRLEGDRDLVTIVIEAFLEDLPRQLQTLEEMLRLADAKAVGRQAHSIKGASANVGGELLRQLARVREQAADHGDLQSVNSHMAELNHQFLLLREAIRKEFPPK